MANVWFCSDLHLGHKNIGKFRARIDPTKGYVKGNVEVISSLANTMKSKADTKMLQHFALEILRRWPIEQTVL